MAFLQAIQGRAKYIAGSNNLGVVLTGDGGAVAIDTGLDKDTGKLIRKALEAEGLQLRAIISTHHHADHIGGNDYLLRNIPGVEVYAPRLEAGLIEHPVLEPIYLSMGATPIAALQTKWLMAKAAPVHHRIDGERLDVAGLTLEVVPLAGHSLGQIGLAIDGVCYAADGFFGTTILQKHGIPYAHDVREQRAAIDRLGRRGELFFLPGHGTLVGRDELEDTLAANLAAIDHGAALVREAIREPATMSVVVKRVQQALGLTLAGIPQYAIFASAVSAHLSYLDAQGQAQVALERDGLVWSSAP